MLNFKNHFMIRDAKLYLLSDKDWKPLADIILDHINYTLRNDITIFQLMSFHSTGQNFAILTLSENADFLVEQFGAIPLPNPESNTLTHSLYNYVGEPLFGEKENLAFLKRP